MKPIQEATRAAKNVHVLLTKDFLIRYIHVCTCFFVQVKLMQSELKLVKEFRRKRAQMQRELDEVH